MTLEEFLRAAGDHGPCVGLLLTPGPSTPPDGVKFRSVDAQHITTLETLFDAFAEAWKFPPGFIMHRNRDAFNDWMRDLDNLADPWLNNTPARAYLTQLLNAHLLSVNGDEIFSWFVNAIPFYREYYRDGAKSPVAFGLLLSAPTSRLLEVQNRWLQAGVQVRTVAVFEPDMSEIPPTVSVGLPASESATKYKSLISRFIKGHISAADFETAYLQSFKTSEDMLGQDEFDILQELFRRVDEYVAEPELRARILADDAHVHKFGRPLDDEELRACAEYAYWQLFGE